MMARYTVHLPKLAKTPEAALEGAVFVRDGWSWGAFFFGPLWLFWHRHWVVGLIALVVYGALLGALDALPLNPAALSIAHFLLSLLFGLEGASLRRFGLARAGFAEVAVVAGGPRDEMERRFFAALEAGIPLMRSGTSVPQVSAGQVNPGGVIGLFPQART